MAGKKTRNHDLDGIVFHSSPITQERSLTTTYDQDVNENGNLGDAYEMITTFESIAKSDKNHGDHNKNDYGISKVLQSLNPHRKVRRTEIADTEHLDRGGFLVASMTFYILLGRFP